MTVAQVFPQVAMAFSAVFVTWLDGGQEQEVRRWAERLSAALAAGGMVVILAVLFLAEHLVPVVLGAAYRPVTPSLIVLAASLLLLALSNLAHVLAMVRDRPDIALSSAAVRLAALWIIGPFLIRAEQSLGASLAALVASVLYTLFIVVRVQRVMPFSLRRWLLAVALGGVCLPLLWLRSSLPVDSLLFVLSVAVYAALLLAGRVVTWRELASAWQMIRPTGGARASERVP
jgi:O-antigen/teichoic acid export membrane protein